ncbi:MAG: HAD-IB family phosphatase [Dehalococcoidia bacterium]|nr:HAD-IB family phosphatase [Dehalococcoidia bacterium]
MATVLCLDFDNTLVFENTTRMLFARFASPAWREEEARYLRGELSVEQYNARALDLVPSTVTREEMARFVEESAHPRPGSLALTGWAEWQGWVVAVLSNGLDFALDAVLDPLGLDRAARHCGRTRLAYRWRVRYDSPRGIEVQEGFKLSYVAAFRDAGDFVVYVGDGASDVAAARRANVVFARDALWQRLAGDPRVFPFDTFDDVRILLEREAAGWLTEARQRR